MAVVDGHEHEASAKLGTSTYGLEFNLTRPPSMIVPNGDLTPKQKASGIVMDSFRTLARLTSFVVYTAASTLAKCQLVWLCEATSSGRLRSTPKFLDVPSLYGGKGGKVIELEPVNIASAESAPPQVESSPSYNDLGVGPSPAGLSSHQSTFLRVRTKYLGYFISQSLATNAVEPARAPNTLQVPVHTSL